MGTCIEEINVEFVRMLALCVLPSGHVVGKPDTFCNRMVCLYSSKYDYAVCNLTFIPIVIEVELGTPGFLMPMVISH